MTEVTKPGWYPRPDMQNTLGFWDGTQWTGQTQPSVGRVVDEHQAGQTLTMVGLALAVVFPIAGAVVGFMLLAKSEAKAGVVVLLLSVGMAYFWLDLIVSS